jgi:hypothetical protein
MTRKYRLLIAITLAGAAWFTPAFAGAADKLQPLVNDTAAQIQLAYRQHPDEQATRREQLAAVIAAWRAAPRNEANNQRLANWLRAAIQSSMPGSNEPLPQTPSFTAIVKTESQPQPQIAPQPTEAQSEQAHRAEPKEAEAHQAEPTQAEAHQAPAELQPAEAAFEKKASADSITKPNDERTDDPFRDDPFRDDPETETK